jgi:transposase
MEGTKRYVGIDVAKAKLHVFIGSTRETFSVANTELVIPDTLAKLGRDDFVIIEGTGSLECLAEACWRRAESRLYRQSPSSARPCPRHRTLAKNDRLDAEVLAFRRGGETCSAPISQ